MNEKFMQDIIVKYPSEILGEEGLEYFKREVSTGNRRIDVILKDRRDRIVLVEVQKGSLDTKHIDRHIDFVEGFIEHNPELDVRLLFVANRIDPLRKQFLERRGYEYLEIPQSRFLEVAKKHNISTDEYSSSVITSIPKNSEELVPNYVNHISSTDLEKRENIIRYAKNIAAKYFWKRFFEEIDKRSFVKATFNAAEFGVHIHNTKHFNSSNGKYSLMFTRSGAFKMNDRPYKGRAWNGLNRMKNWCITPGLPEKFYSELKNRNLLNGMDWIKIEDIVKGKSEDEVEKVVKDLFYCIDLFK